MRLWLHIKTFFHLLYLLVRHRFDLDKIEDVVWSERIALMRHILKKRQAG